MTNMQKIGARYTGLILFSSFLLFYAYTLAPTFVWSDPSKLAVFSYNRDYFPLVGSHAIHCFLGSLVYLFPFSYLEAAYLQNLLCAIYGALALLIIYYTLRRLSFSNLSSVFTVAFLGISHMFWLTSVIFESYALLLLSNAIWIYLLVRWKQQKENFAYLYLLTLAIILGILNHLLILLYAPFIVIFTIWYSKRRFKVAIYWCFLIFIFSLILIFNHKFINEFISRIGTAIHLFARPSKFGSLTEYFKQFFKNLIIYPGYLFYQFPFLGFFLGIYGICSFPRRRDRIFFLLLALLILTILFWTFHAWGKHAFIHTPVYLFFSFFICIGIDKFYKVYKKMILWLLILNFFITPVIYYFTPRILTAWGINIRRNFPYRNANIYYLWPSKRGYYGAQRFATEALNRVNQDGILIADFTIAMPMWYLQFLGNYRQDVFVFLPEAMSFQATLPGEILWPRLRRFLDYNISLRGSVYLADKYSIMFDVTHKDGKPITSWDLINKIYKVEWVWPIYKISPIKK
jgi:4-amino-4-deoxy-L-arabinose transferase-like glycosyltransferase